MSILRRSQKRLSRAIRRVFRGSIVNRLTIRDPLAPDQLRLLAFGDVLGPTFEINWLRPLAASRSAGRTALWLMEERAFEDEAKLSRSAGTARALDSLLLRMQPHLIAASRYGGESAALIVDAARRHNIPFVFHIDDNLLAVPPELGASKAAKYNSPKRIEAITCQLARADLTYVSTEALLAQLQGLGVEIGRHYVGAIAGGVDPIDPPDIARKKDRPLVLGYMASSGHTADLALVTPSLVRIKTKWPDVRLEIFGSLAVPSELTNLISEVHPPIQGYEAFVARLASLNWDLGIAPLRGSSFNLAKTNTKWIEYTAAGIAVVCSDHPVYRQAIDAGAAIGAADDEWYTKLADMITDAEARASTLRSAQRLLAEKYTLQHLRCQVADMLRYAGLRDLSDKVL